MNIEWSRLKEEHEKKRSEKKSPSATRKRDIILAIVTLAVMTWFCVLDLSNCVFVDSPFAFVRGCNNYGINWNVFIAPTGMVVILAAPMAAVYWLLRVVSLIYNFVKASYLRT